MEIEENTVEEHALQCEEKHQKEPVIDWRMIPAKSSFFFCHALYGCSIPYLNVFLVSVGLTASQAGFISGLRTVVSFICGPAWGALADYTDRRRLVYLLLATGTISTLFPLPWIASFAHIKPVISNGSLSNGTELTNQKPQNENENKLLFHVMLISLLVSAVFDLPLLGYHDALVVQVTNTNTICRRPTTFGSQRVFGSIGFGLANLICGFAADEYIPEHTSSYTVVFYVLLPTGLIMMPFGLYLHTMTSTQSGGRKSNRNKHLNVLRQTIRTCSAYINIWFFITVFIMGIANTLVYGFVFLYMEEELKASKSIMGLSLLVACGTEILVFPFASKIMKWFGGALQCIIISIFANFARFLMISFVENPWLIVPIQLLTAIAFALFWACAIEQTNLISPKEINTTLISILNCIHFSLSHLVGSMTCGVLYQRFGGRKLFLGSSIVFLLWAVISLAIVCYGKNVSQQNMLEGNGDSMKNKTTDAKVEEEILMDEKTQ